MKRVLHICPDISIGSGIAQVVLNWHRNIDRTKIQFDYLYLFDKENNFAKEIKTLGGNVYKIEWSGVLHLWRFCKEIYNLFKEHNYQVLHSHLTQMNFFYFPIAKFCGVKNIIQHVHSIKWSDRKLASFRNFLMLHTVWAFIDYKLACSEAAGQFYFGRNYKVLNNGVDLQKFYPNTSTRRKLRAELGLENKFVVGHFGRFESEKNHKFLLKVFNNIKKKKDNAFLLLSGEGPLKEDILQEIKQLGFLNSTIILGLDRQVEDLYQVLDALVLPSKHEGFGLVALEGVACGVRTFVSENFPALKGVIGIEEISLSKGAMFWAEQIVNDHSVNFDKLQLKDSPFDIKKITKELEDFYFSLLRD